MLSRPDRRSFIRQSAAIGAAIAVPAVRAWGATKLLGPNDQIGVGMIGAGGRAEELLNDIVKISLRVRKTAVGPGIRKQAARHQDREVAMWLLVKAAICLVSAKVQLRLITRARKSAILKVETL